MRLLCLGYSYTARHFVARHRARFAHIAATARRAETLAMLDHAGITPVVLDDNGAALQQAVQSCDVILISAGPEDRGDPFVGPIGTALAQRTQSPPALLYLSTVGVYGDHAGAWVSESTVPRPASQRSHWRLAAEQAWLDLGLKTGASIQIFRLAGIYGPGRSAIDNLRAGTAKRIIKPGQVFNRIHVDDIGETLVAALANGTPGAIWNVADDEPAPPQDVVTFAAGLLGLPPPPEVPYESAVLSPMARSFYGETKRISNRAIRQTLGVRLIAPTYREGMRAVLAAETKNAPAENPPERSKS